MSLYPTLTSYNQGDVQSLYQSGSIAPNIDSYGNLAIEDVAGELFLSAITIPLINEVYSATKVETKYDVAFSEL
jgi:hypothetical protein